MKEIFIYLRSSTYLNRISGKTIQLYEKIQEELGSSHHINELIRFDLTPENMFTKQTEGYSTLYLVVRHGDIELLGLSLAGGANPWVKNDVDRDVPLASAAEQGNFTKFKMLLDAMECSVTTEESLGAITSIMRKIVCNYIPIEARETEINHAECLNLMLHSNLCKKFFEDPNKLDEILCLVNGHFDPELKRKFEQFFNVRFTHKSNGKFYYM